MSRVLQRLTTQYDSNEDRLRVSGELSNRVTVVLWLTQRLANALLPHLCGWLESSKAVIKDDGGFAHRVLVQSFEQLRARQALSPEQPVLAEFPLECWLVESVQLATGAAGVQLEFKAVGRAVVALSLSSLQLRQWLTILLNQYRKADWSQQGWPEWMQDSLLVPLGQPGYSLH